MPHFKDTNNALYYLSDIDIINGGENFLPVGCVYITENEAEEIRLANLPPNALIDSQIAELEVIQEIRMTPRAKREFYLGVIAALGLNPNMNPGTSELASIQAQIVALRALRK